MARRAHQLGQRWVAAEHFPQLWYQQFHQKDSPRLSSVRAKKRREFISATSSRIGRVRRTRSCPISRSGSTISLSWPSAGGLRLAHRHRPLPRPDHPRRGEQGTEDHAAELFFVGPLRPRPQVRMVRSARDYVNDLSLECAEDAGHFVPFERPDLTNARMLDFFRRVLAR
jgi:pimeloyl-ACP methyl ester carboxylesterase